MSSIHQSQAPEFQKAFDYPYYTEGLPDAQIEEGRYVVRFARTPEEIDAALRLRFEVFNLELKEGLESSYLTERDEDDFDQTSHHLLVTSMGSAIWTAFSNLSSRPERCRPISTNSRPCP